MQRTKEPKPKRIQAGVQLDPEIWEKARIRAIVEKRGAGHIIDDALRAYFAKVEKEEKRG
jgi:hypothetical protein